MRTRLVIFDFDGVLIDSHRIVPRIYRAILEELHVPAQLRDQAIHDGDFYDLQYRKTLAKFGITEQERIRQAEQIWHRLAEQWEDECRLYPGVRRTVEELSKVYLLAVLSNNTKERVDRDLGRHGILKHFRLTVGVEGDEAKPNPIGLLRCMETLKATPAETVYIGDMDDDITAGRRAGIKKVIAVTYGYHSIKRLAPQKPDALIGDAAGLLLAVQ